MARRTLYGGLWKSFLVLCELVNDLIAQANTQEATQGSNQVLRSLAAAAGFDAEITSDHANSIVFDTEVKADFASYKTVVDALKTLANDLRTYVSDQMLAIATITVSATAEKFKTTTTAIYRIAGTHYTKAATDNLVFSAANTINTAGAATTAHWGVWLVQIDSAGTVSTKPGGGLADQDYADEATAIAALPAVDASNIQLGYITVQGLASTAWTATTSNLTVGGGAGNCTARNFYDLPAAASLPAAVTDSAPAAMTASPNSTLTAQSLGSDGRVGVGMVIDATPADVQFNNAIFYQILGQEYFKDVDAAVDISAECVGAGDTIAISTAGALWMFVAADGTVDGETDKAAQDYASAVLALAQYSIATNTLPIANKVPVGVISVVEGGSGTFTWGTDSISDETEVFYSFEGLPGIESELASFALDAAAATFTYGAVTLVLGTGTRVAATGKANVVLNDTTTTALGKTAAYLLYVLADDVEACVLVGAAYASVQAAKDAVRDLAPNPLMPVVGAIYVTARKIPFIAATTNFDAEGIDTEFVTYGVGTNRQEHGRSNGTTFTPIDDVTFAAIGRP
ncbi:MAG: hypothetical protein NUW01_05125 [Gemmatimonadaceae bacterium]|nr:hypothetical protein [Gemmatimonadaceae bacterium]